MHGVPLLTMPSHARSPTSLAAPSSPQATDHARQLVEKYVGKPFFDLPYARGEPLGGGWLRRMPACRPAGLLHARGPAAAGAPLLRLRAAVLHGPRGARLLRLSNRRPSPPGFRPPQVCGA